MDIVFCDIDNSYICNLSNWVKSDMEHTLKDMWNCKLNLNFIPCYLLTVKFKPYCCITFSETIYGILKISLAVALLLHKHFCIHFCISLFKCCNLLSRKA